MLWDGIVAAHQSTDMNGQRFLFRLWLIASGLWMCAWTYYLWRTCERFGQDLWCPHWTTRRDLVSLQPEHF